MSAIKEPLKEFRVAAKRTFRDEMREARSAMW
jgi:hypothetical protein